MEAAERKAAGTTAFEVPHMSATDTAGEAAMLPRMVQMVLRIVAAGIVAHPFPTAMYVGSIGMSSLIV